MANSVSGKAAPWPILLALSVIFAEAGRRVVRDLEQLVGQHVEEDVLVVAAEVLGLLRQTREELLVRVLVEAGAHLDLDGHSGSLTESGMGDPPEPGKAGLAQFSAVWD